MDVRRKLLMHVSVVSLATTLVACGGDSNSIETKSDPLGGGGAQSNVAQTNTAKNEASTPEPVVAAPADPESAPVKAQEPAPEVAANDAKDEEAAPAADTKAPVAKKLTPADGTADVALDAEVSAMFSEDMFAKTVIDSSFLLKDAVGEAIDASVDFDASTNKATLSPNADLALSTIFTAQLKSDVTDLAGNALVDTTWKFTTRDGLWETGKYVSQERVMLSREFYPFAFKYGSSFENIHDTPNSVIDADGNVMVIWSQFDGKRFAVMVNRYTPDGGWGEVTEIDINDNNSISPKLSIDGSGNVLAVWIEQDKNYINNIHSLDKESFASRRADGASVSKNIMGRMFNSDSGWGKLEVVAGDINSGDLRGIDKGIYSNLHLDTNANGDSVVIWQKNTLLPWVENSRGRSSTLEIMVNTYRPEVGWGTEEVISDEYEQPFEYNMAGLPQVTIDKNRNIIAIWRTFDLIHQKNHVLVRHYKPASGWSPFTEIGDAGNSLYLRDQDLAINGNSKGQTVAIWTLFDEALNKNSLMANTYDPKTGWGVASEVELEDLHVENPQVSLNINSEGSAIAVWVKSSWVKPISGPKEVFLAKKSHRDSANNMGQVIMVSHFNINSGWSVAEQIGIGSDLPDTVGRVKGFYMGEVRNEIKPQITIDSSGNAIAIWNQLKDAEENNYRYIYAYGKEKSALMDIMVNRYIQGKGWGKAYSIDTANLGLSPQIVSNAKGKASAIWVQRDQHGGYDYGYLSRRKNSEKSAVKVFDGFEMNFFKPTLSTIKSRYFK